MSPAVSISYRSIFESNLVGLADFAGSKFQRMANWPSLHVSYNSPSFDFIIETGPVRYPLEFESAQSANPTRRLFSKIDSGSSRGQGTFFNAPGRKSLPKC